MKIVSVAPRRHLLQSARAIVPPRGDSREFILSADCLIWGWELYAVFDEKHIAEWGNLDLMFRWTQPSLPDNIRAEFASRHTKNPVQMPLALFLYSKFSSGCDWGLPRPWEAGTSFSVRVVNGSEDPIELRMVALGEGELPVAPPDGHPLYPGTPPLVHVDASNHLPREKWDSFLSSSPEEWIAWLVENGVERETAEGLTQYKFNLVRRKWLDAPTVHDYGFGEIQGRGVGGYWWRVRKSDGTWSVCKFDVEPIPADAADYDWAEYRPCIQ